MRYWTEDEVRAELPRMRVLIDALRRGEHQGVVAQTNGPVLSLTGGMPQVCRSNAASFAAGPMSVALSPDDADQGIIRTESLTKVYKGADFRLLTIERGEWGS